MADEPAKIVLGETAISAIEGTPGRRWFHRSKHLHRSKTQCENCGAQLQGHWCGQCGQAAIDYRRSFRHVIADVLESFLNWDSKFFTTIALLILKPWQLTNEFLEGKRVRYVNPLRLYLLASILFFFAINYWAKNVHVEPRQLSPKDRAEIQAALQEKDLPPQVRAKLEEILREPSPGPTTTNEHPGQPTPAARERDIFLQFGSGKNATAFDKWMEAHAKEKLGEHGTKLQLFLSTLVSNLPYMMLGCIPLFALVLKTLYLRRRIFYIDHLIYALHIHSFAYVGIMFIVLATIGLNRVAPGAFAGWIIALLWIAFVVQIFLSIRRVYRQSWFISTFKFIFGGLVYLIVLAVALCVTCLITLALP